jgi:hypothetical protein
VGEEAVDCLKEEVAGLYLEVKEEGEANLKMEEVEASYLNLKKVEEGAKVNFL